MAILHLPACPICGSTDSLASQARERSTYACEECGSVLVWLGDDFWLHGDRWVLQEVGCEEMRHLQHRPLTVPELQELAEEAVAREEQVRDKTDRSGDEPIILEEDGEVVDASFTVLPPTEPEQRDRAGARPRQPGAAGQETHVEAALVPMAQVLPEGLTLAIVRYDGARAVPVAVFEEGELRGLDPALQRRRGRGSPLLLIAVGTTLMCLVCALAALLVPKVRNSVLTLGAAPRESLPAVSPVPVIQSEAAVQGSSDYVDDTGARIVVGEVLNTANYPLSFIKVLARFYGVRGEPVGSSVTFAELTALEPGDAAPFALDTRGLPPFARYELQADATAAEQAPLRLEVSKYQATTAQAGAFLLTGEVRNAHDFSVRFGEVIATYYDASNRVLRVRTVLVGADTLEPGQVASFELSLPDAPAGLTHYKLQAQAVQE
jgi:hypothetical protein